MSKLAEACKLSYLDWIAEQPVIDELPEPEFSRKHIKRMEKLFDKMRGDTYHYFTRKTVRVMVVAAVLVALMLTAFVIPSSREFLIENFDIFGVYEMTEHNNNSVNGGIEVGYIPEGYELKTVDENNKFITNVYESYNNLSFIVYKWSSSAQVEFNTENVAEVTHTFNNIDYICFKNSNGTNGIIWTTNDYIYRIYGNLTTEEMLIIAQSVK